MDNSESSSKLTIRFIDSAIERQHSIDLSSYRDNIGSHGYGSPSSSYHTSNHNIDVGLYPLDEMDHKHLQRMDGKLSTPYYPSSTRHSHLVPNVLNEFHRNPNDDSPNGNPSEFIDHQVVRSVAPISRHINHTKPISSSPVSRFDPLVNKFSGCKELTLAERFAFIDETMRASAAHHSVRPISPSPSNRASIHPKSQGHENAECSSLFSPFEQTGDLTPLTVRSSGQSSVSDSSRQTSDVESLRSSPNSVPPIASVNLISNVENGELPKSAKRQRTEGNGFCEVNKNSASQRSEVPPLRLHQSTGGDFGPSQSDGKLSSQRLTERGEDHRQNGGGGWSDRSHLRGSDSSMRPLMETGKDTEERNERIKTAGTREGIETKNDRLNETKQIITISSTHHHHPTSTASSTGFSNSKNAIHRLNDTTSSSFRQLSVGGRISNLSLLGEADLPNSSYQSTGAVSDSRPHVVSGSRPQVVSESRPYVVPHSRSLHVTSFQNSPTSTAPSTSISAPSRFPGFPHSTVPGSSLTWRLPPSYSVKNGRVEISGHRPHFPNVTPESFNNTNPFDSSSHGDSSIYANLNILGQIYRRVRFPGFPPGVIPGSRLTMNAQNMYSNLHKVGFPPVKEPQKKTGSTSKQFPGSAPLKAPPLQKPKPQEIAKKSTPTKG